MSQIFTHPSKLYQRVYTPKILPWLLLIFANSLIFLDAPADWRYLAALLLLAILPGWGWAAALNSQLDRTLVTIGLSLALTVLGGLGAVYLPGPFNLQSLLIILNSITILGLISPQFRSVSSTSQPLTTEKIYLPWLLLIVLLAIILRLPHLGYAEFHEDEAEALMLGVRLLQGEDYAIFLHRKGPAQMLLPIAFWLVTDQITEFMARFPFALSSILSALTLFVIGRRWFGWQAGLIAALLWAINGYAIGFGRMVQYQALIFFMGPLAIYCGYVGWQWRQAHQLFIAAILLAVSLLAHFDALLLLPAAGFVGWLALTQKRPSLRLSAFSSGLIFLGLLASFYVPYVLDPEFANTTAYLTESRVKPGLLYNNLDLLQRLDKDYSSHFYLFITILGLIGFIIWSLLKEQGASQWGIIGTTVLSISTIIWPDLWQISAINLAVIPWGVLGLLLFLKATTTEIKIGLLLFGAPLVGYVFLVDDPRTHLYILYQGALLLAGLGWQWILRLQIGQRSLQPLLISIFILISVPIIIYEATIFLQTESSLTKLRNQWDGSMWEWAYDDLPKPREYFGYPKKEGWKAIGALRSQGEFPGDFRSVNEDFIVPIWYNFGEARSCYETPAYIFVRTTDIPKDFNVDTYQKVGHIEREGETRLDIFTQTSAVNSDIFTSEAFEENFDKQATPQKFSQQAVPTHLVGTSFGTDIRFIGYDLENPTLSPSDTLHLNLYWSAINPPKENYRAFAHLTDGATLWAQQDDMPACRLPTTVWRASQNSVGQFRLEINPDTPPGQYSLIIGLYQAETLERLKITQGVGQIGDNFLWLGDITISP